jgi:integrase
MKQVRIGHWPAMSPAKAEVDWADLRQQRDAGRCPATERRQQRTTEQDTIDEADAVYRVRDLVREYVDGHLRHNRKPKGAAEMERLLTTLLGPIEEQPAATVTRAQAFDLLDSVAKRAPVVAGQLRGELGAAWDRALDAGRLVNATNWWRVVLRGKMKSQGKKISGKHVGVDKRFLNDSEVGKLIAWLPNFSKLVHDVLTMYLWTCTRGSEIVSMERQEVCDEQGELWWTIPKHKTKNSRRPLATDLRVPLMGRAAEAKACAG